MRWNDLKLCDHCSTFMKRKIILLQFFVFHSFFSNENCSSYWIAVWWIPALFSTLHMHSKPILTKSDKETYTLFGKRATNCKPESTKEILFHSESHQIIQTAYNILLAFPVVWANKELWNYVFMCVYVC